jgi:hypothetical protein
MPDMYLLILTFWFQEQLLEIYSYFRYAEMSDPYPIQNVCSVSDDSFLHENSPIHVPQFQVMPSIFNFRDFNGPATMFIVHDTGMPN